MVRLRKNSYPLFYAAFAILWMIGMLASNLGPVAIGIVALVVLVFVPPCILCSIPIERFSPAQESWLDQNGVARQRVSFLGTLGVLTKDYTSGCGNITLLYIWIPILAYWLRGSWYALSTLWRGRTHAQNQWLAFVLKQLPPSLGS